VKPDWRDPNMPVLRNYRFANGETREWVDPDYERRYREHMMQSSPQPSWRDDPTYQNGGSDANRTHV